jgi:60 kDa SS-A/Ro ribonucleoprotein
MSSPYASFGTRKTGTPQTEPIQGRTDQVKNNAGGYVFAVSQQEQLKRFILLGSAGGTYYVGEKKLTADNAGVVIKAWMNEPEQTASLIRDISDGGRAPKNDPALFALALGFASENPEARKAASAIFNRVVRTGTHLFTFVDIVNGLRGWGSGLRKAVARWYMDKPVEKLAYQAIKYQQRGGWSHRDVLRLTHPLAAADDLQRRNLFNYMCRGLKVDEPIVDLPPIIIAAEAAKTSKVLPNLIRQFNLPREALPTEALNDPAVWEALLHEPMPYHALIRNLNRLTNHGLLKPFSPGAKLVTERLTNADELKRARLHPLSILVAAAQYAQGKGDKGSLTWTPEAHVMAALDEALGKSFDYIEPTGKNFLIAIDVSGSMNNAVAGLPISARAAAVTIALATLRSEPNCHVVGFFAGTGGLAAGSRREFGYGGQDGISPLPFTKNTNLVEAVKYVANLPFGGTDCSLPFAYAMYHQLEVDAFVVITDNETYAGTPHPSQAFAAYRNASGIDAKSIVVATAATPFTIADPKDPNMLDIVGFDTSTPAAISAFVS